MSGPSRRSFLSKMITGLGGLTLLGEPWISFWAKAWGKIKRKVLPRGTDRNSLINERPQDLDARNLEITPVKEFGIMGLSDHPVNLNLWTLQVKGWIQTPLRLSYPQVRDLPFIERKVLLICPGYFANQGLWKGISIRTLLEKAGAKPGANYVTISGPEGSYTKPERFPLKEILSDQVFLAYQVNGEDLPQQNGFPLRLVAEDYLGYTWVKYVDTIEVDKV
ncbi:MAG: molybdopterin-dependent oxidoreductase [Deltaproteobacteria bacterium]|nr:molybdopterin-dependent oxidoreductase [Deltaproteobacteria bacterium]